MKKLIVPKFATEAEEARWWDDHMDIVGEHLLEAMRNGTAQHGTPERLVREARAAKTIELPDDDLDRALRFARRKKVDGRQYILDLLHSALDREQAAMKRAARRKSA